jgi:predicted HTH transcriptional regulator
MTESDLRDLLALGHEVPGVEFKGPGPRAASSLFAKVARAALAMANRRGGGAIVIGVEDERGKIRPVGLNHKDLATWAYDVVGGALATYADPFVEFHLEAIICDGRNLVVITVEEFANIPVLCKKDYPGVLRAGACYVRRRGRIESSEIPTQAEMRELLDLAIEKGVRRFIQQAHRGGLSIDRAAAISDQERFDRERDDFE